MNWRKLAGSLILGGDHTINEREAHILRHEMLADRVVDKEEVEFLVELQRAAKHVHGEFELLLLQVLKKVVLRDGAVADSEALWLRRLVFVDNKVTPLELRFLEDLKREAKAVGQEFQSLYRDATKSPAVGRK